jgi:hypothetical protein
MHVQRFKSFGCVVMFAALSALSGEAASEPLLNGEEAAKLADAYFLRGKALLKDGNIKEAYKQYKASWELKKSYDIAANLGNVEYVLGMPRDATEHLAFSVRNAAVSVGSDRLDKIKKLLDQAKTLVGVVVVQVNLEGADIFIDGELVGRSPLAYELYVDPGLRSIEARLPGHETAKQSVDCPRLLPQTVTLTLKPVVAPPDQADPVESVARPKDKVPRKSRLLPLAIGGGVALAGLAVGIPSLLVAGSKRSAADLLYDQLKGTPLNISACYMNPSAECAQLASDSRTAGTLQAVAIAGFVTAGLAAMATGTYALLPATPAPAPAPAPSGQVRASFSVGPDGGGLTIHGRF